MTRLVPTLLPTLLLLAGCSDSRWLRKPPPTDPAALAHPDPRRHTAYREAVGPAVPPGYRVACPDVLEVRFLDRPALDCLTSVDVDGRIPLGKLGGAAVAGGTTDDARTAVAKLAGVDAARVTVTVADARAGTIYLHGPERNRQLEVACLGPETVLDFLHRSGALAAGCFNPRDVTVLRPNVAAGLPAQVFRVDLDAVVLDGDATTNVTLTAGDQVYVGESRRSSFSRLLPEWAKPAYRRMMGLVPEGWPWVRFDRAVGPVLR